MLYVLVSTAAGRSSTFSLGLREIFGSVGHKVTSELVLALASDTLVGLVFPVSLVSLPPVKMRAFGTWPSVLSVRCLGLLDQCQYSWFLDLYICYLSIDGQWEIFGV